MLGLPSPRQQQLGLLSLLLLLSKRRKRVIAKPSTTHCDRRSRFIPTSMKLKLRSHPWARSFVLTLISSFRMSRMRSKGSRLPWRPLKEPATSWKKVTRCCSPMPRRLLSTLFVSPKDWSISIQPRTVTLRFVTNGREMPVRQHSSFLTLPPITRELRRRSRSPQTQHWEIGMHLPLRALVSLVIAFIASPSGTRRTSRHRRSAGTAGSAAATWSVSAAGECAPAPLRGRPR